MTELDVALKALQIHDARHPRPSAVTQRQAAEMWGVSAATVSRMVRSRRVKLNKLGMIPITEVDDVLTAS